MSGLLATRLKVLRMLPIVSHARAPPRPPAVRGRRAPALVALSAVARGETRHSRAVRRWLEDVVIGLGFCPWAAPAAEAKGIRVVTSTATSSQEVLADLADEARELWTAEKASTTLVVCPAVEAWKSFPHFHAFVSWHLDGGFALEELGVKVVPFHPQFALRSEGFKVGDQVQVPGPDGQNALAEVLSPDVGRDEEGEPCMAVRFAGGEEGLLRHASLTLGRLILGEREQVFQLWRELLELPKPRMALDTADPELLIKNFTSWAPRPVLHLLKLPDLERADACVPLSFTFPLKR